MAPRSRGRTVLHRHTGKGYSLVEALIGLLLTVLVTLVVLGLFDASSRLYRTQIHLANLQQSVRAGQYLLLRWSRMTGRGGLPAARGLVIANDVDTDRRILVGSTAPEVPVVLEGSDVLTLRGVFSSPVYQIVDSPDPDDPRFHYDPLTGDGFLTVLDPGPSGVRQSLTPLEDLLDDDVADALLLISPTGELALVELDPDHEEVAVDTSTTPPTTRRRLRFVARGGLRTGDYAALLPEGAASLDAGSFANLARFGVLEEYRFYIRDRDRPGGRLASSSDLTLELARTFPGTEIAYEEDLANLSQTVAEDIIDLQLALGFDIDADGALEEATDPAERGEDEWLFNAATETAIFTGSPGYLRVTTLGRGPQPDRGYLAPPLVDIEDRSYDGHPFNSLEIERRYRRLALQTIIELRNL